MAASTRAVAKIVQLVLNTRDPGRRQMLAALDSQCTNREEQNRLYTKVFFLGLEKWYKAQEEAVTN